MECFSGLQARESNEAGLQAPRSNNYERTSLRAYISTGIPLPSQQEEKVEERVRAIGSEFPVLVKLITFSDVVTSSSLVSSDTTTNIRILCSRLFILS